MPKWWTECLPLSYKESSYKDRRRDYQSQGRGTMNISTADDKQAQVQLIMTPLPLQTSPPSSTVKELADQMNKHGRGAIVIVDSKDHPIGIITERDIVRRVVSAEKDRNETTASDVMSKPGHNCGPRDEHSQCSADYDKIQDKKTAHCKRYCAIRNSYCQRPGKETP